jgi:hypothetical protein
LFQLFTASKGFMEIMASLYLSGHGISVKLLTGNGGVVFSFIMEKS